MSAAISRCVGAITKRVGGQPCAGQRARVPAAACEINDSMDITGLDDNLFYTSSTQALSNVSLPACELSLKTIYSRCGCDNLCVLLMAVLTPAMLLAMYMAYRTTHMLLARLGCAHPAFDEESSRCAAAREELKALASIQALPSQVWGGKPSTECSLCLQPVARGDVVRRLRCRHTFRTFHAAAHSNRRAPTA